MFFSLWSLISSPVYCETLRPFTTDGCSLFPDGLPKHRDLWLQCCVEHDKAYWLGGTRTEREAADQALSTCVAQVNEPQIAKLMLNGVRVGGSPYWLSSFRWGYGWSYGRGYRPLSVEERALADSLVEEMDQVDLPEKNIDTEVETTTNRPLNWAQPPLTWSPEFEQSY